MHARWNSAFGKESFFGKCYNFRSKKNVNYNVTSSPTSVYVKYLDDFIEAERGRAFTLNLKAFQAGERSTSTVYQDFRYNKAYIYADWNADLTFSADEKIAELGQQPPSNVILGNYDAVMNISQSISVPATAILQSIPVRVLYHNAWMSLSNGSCSDVFEGMTYDFKLKVVMTSGIKHQKENLFNAYYNAFSKNIVCTGDFTINTKFDVINSNGVFVKTQSVTTQLNEVMISVPNLSKGCYLVLIRNSKTSEIKKIIA